VRISFFFKGWIIFHCMYTPRFVSLLIWAWEPLSYYE
jgi:hypothetical protein